MISENDAWKLVFMVTHNICSCLEPEKKLRCNQMPNLELYPGQIEALKKMHNGCVLVGGTGSGKSRLA